MSCKGALTAAACALILAAPAAAARLDFTGVSDGNIGHQPPERSNPHLAAIQASVTMAWVTWDDGQTSLTPKQTAYLNGHNQLAGEMVPIIKPRYAKGGTGIYPRTVGRREQFCSLVADVVARYRPVAVQVANEPNGPGFFGPAEGAAADYTLLLRVCYPKVKAASPATLVIGPSLNPVTHPARFIRSMGAYYRNLHVNERILDIYTHHPYPRHGLEPPDKLHPGRWIGMGDVADLRSAIRQAFKGTIQGRVPLVIWWTETGVAGPGETPSWLAGNPDPIGWYARAHYLAACQRNVRGFFGFPLLSDPPSSMAWRAGYLHDNWVEKGNLARIGDKVKRSREGTLGCGGFAEAVK
jgi:hypothetical protein